jgi:hypothetical protein
MDFIGFDPGKDIGDFEEYDSFSLSELQSVNTHCLTVECDLHFKQGTFSEVLACFRKG